MLSVSMKEVASKYVFVILFIFLSKKHLIFNFLHT